MSSIQISDNQRIALIAYGDARASGDADQIATAFVNALHTLGHPCVVDCKAGEGLKGIPFEELAFKTVEKMTNGVSSPECRGVYVTHLPTGCVACSISADKLETNTSLAIGELGRMINRSSHFNFESVDQAVTLILDQTDATASLKRIVDENIGFNEITFASEVMTSFAERQPLRIQGKK